MCEEACVRRHARWLVNGWTGGAITCIKEQNELEKFDDRLEECSAIVTDLVDQKAVTRCRGLRARDDAGHGVGSVGLICPWLEECFFDEVLQRCVLECVDSVGGGKELEQERNAEVGYCQVGQQ